MEKNVFKVVEYKRDGNSVKIVNRELVPVGEYNTLFVSQDSERVKLYKTCKGFAVEIGTVPANFAENPLNKAIMADAERESVLEMIIRLQWFPGLHLMCFIELSDPENASKAQEIRAEWLKRREEEEQQREQEEQRKREERKRKEQERKKALMEQAEEFLRAGRKTDMITGEMLVYLAEDYGIHIHPRTAHNIYERVNYICGDLSAISYKRLGKKRAPQLQGVFTLAREIKKAVEDGFYINVERVKKGLNNDKWVKDFEGSIKAALG